jgi:predicted ArsR family transcriptional regulator
MQNKRAAINVLLTNEMNDGLKCVADDLGITKSRAVRYICMEYLTKANVLSASAAARHRNL